VGNARIETAATKPYFRHMFREGRVIVPADGWYEWTGEKGHKQPWYIHRKDDAPLFLAAITNYRPYTHQEKEIGMVIVTAAADEGLVDVHDRRPVVFGADDARIWMDNRLPAEQADLLARNRSLPPESFEWYQVSADVNNAKHNEPYLIEPVSSR
jgi:putative SOS response-associated peptidase YedK